MPKKIINNAGGTSLVLSNTDIAFINKGLPEQSPIALDGAVPISLDKITVPLGAGYVHPGAIIKPTAKIHSGAIIGDLAVIGAGAEIGADCIVGDRSIIAPRTKLQGQTIIGMNNHVKSSGRIIKNCLIIMGNKIDVKDIGPGVFIGVDNIVRGCVLGARAAIGIKNKITGSILEKDSQVIYQNIIRASRLAAQVYVQQKNSINQAEIKSAAHLLARITLSAEAIIGTQARIQDGVIIGRGSQLGPRVKIENHCTIAPGVRVGADAEIGELTTIAKGVIIPRKSKIKWGKYVKPPFIIGEHPGMDKIEQKLARLLDRDI